jgi:hypothetical protein
MSLDELYSLCPIELDAVLNTYYKEERAQKEWERLKTFILFNAQGGSEEVKKPTDLISFPWDDENEIDKEESQRLQDRIDTLNKEGRVI